MSRSVNRKNDEDSILKSAKIIGELRSGKHRRKENQGEIGSLAKGSISNQVVAV